MARRGDMVQCHCGGVLLLENDKVPWHKIKDTNRNCQYSGAAAENWPPLPGKPAQIEIGGQMIPLACPSCKERRYVRNAPRNAGYPLECRYCGTFGDLEEFVVSARKSSRSVA